MPGQVKSGKGRGDTCLNHDRWRQGRASPPTHCTVEVTVPIRGRLACLRACIAAFWQHAWNWDALEQTQIDGVRVGRLLEFWQIYVVNSFLPLMFPFTISSGNCCVTKSYQSPVQPYKGYMYRHGVHTPTRTYQQKGAHGRGSHAHRRPHKN
jgi:hypothetical protein